MSLSEAETLALDTLKQVMEDKIEKSNIEIAVVNNSFSKEVLEIKNNFLL